MLFPIDHGNSAMKTVNFVFPSGLIDNPIRPPVDTEMLEYDGKFWTLSGQRISYMRDKTKDERYWIHRQGTGEERKYKPYGRGGSGGRPAAGALRAAAAICGLF